METGPAIETSPDVGELAKALAVAQGKIAAASKSAINPHFNKSYADLASVWEACREPLTSNGLSVVQLPLTSGALVGVSTTLLHASGQWMRSTLWMTPERPGPQAAGSCLTYARRYALSAVAGVAPDDDDANGATGRAEGKAPGAATKAPAAPRANTVKATGQKASLEAVKLLHTLRGKVGGLVVCDPKEPCPYKNGKLCGYHTQLAAFKDTEGNPVKSSKDLSPEQISNLIGRYEKKITEQQVRADKGADLGATIGQRPANSHGDIDAIPGETDEEEEHSTPVELAALENAAYARWGNSYQDEFPPWLKGAFDYDNVTELTKQEAIDATAMIKGGK